MIQKYGNASWQGGLRDGTGQVSTETGALSSQDYSFAKRFGDEKGTNPEELIGAAHAACFAMQFAADIERAGFKAENIDARSTVSLNVGGGGASIDTIHLDVTARVPDASEDQVRQIADGAKQNCPVSKLLGGSAKITMDFKAG